MSEEQDFRYGGEREGSKLRPEVDRRQFLRRTAMAGSAAYVAPQVLHTATAGAQTITTHLVHLSGTTGAFIGVGNSVTPSWRVFGAIPGVTFSFNYLIASNTQQVTITGLPSNCSVFNSSQTWRLEDPQVLGSAVPAPAGEVVLEFALPNGVLGLSPSTLVAITFQCTGSS